MISQRDEPVSGVSIAAMLALLGACLGGSPMLGTAPPRHNEAFGAWLCAKDVHANQGHPRHKTATGKT
jgi:hypothetical protein